MLLCGIVAAVICGACLGIFFIISSPEGKAKVSQYLVPYIVGCVVVFGAFGIWKMTVEVGDEIIVVDDGTPRCSNPDCRRPLTNGQVHAIEQGHRAICENCGQIYN